MEPKKSYYHYHGPNKYDTAIGLFYGAFILLGITGGFIKGFTLDTFDLSALILNLTLGLMLGLICGLLAHAIVVLCAKTQ
ncbi:MAG: hypothetical protein LBJ95_02380 [Oscillospiraceae bacterium]|jgi:hypothetical protein|nr:hypothetical protein [Oscillospiraceae bacterium]